MNTIAGTNGTSRTAIIYPASQLQALAGKQLLNMFFHRGTVSGVLGGSPNFKIYLKEVSNLDWATANAGATLVYNNDPAPIIGSSDGWKSFPLSTPFTYSGTQNLAVFMEYQNLAAGTTAITWSVENSAPCVNTTNNNTTKYLNNNTGTYPATLTNTNYRRPLIGFDFITTCPAPSQLNASNITSNSVALGWIPNGTEGEWAYVVQPQGTGYPTGSGTTVNNNAYTVPSLIPSTNYEVYVRANCGVGNSSYWIGPVNFTTLCVPVTSFPYLETLTTFVPNMCWTEADNGDLISGPATFGSGSWVADGFANSSTTGAMRMTLDATGDNDWVLTSEFTIPTTGYELKFDVAATQANLTSALTSLWESDDFVEVLVTSNGNTNTNWTPILTFNESNVPLNTGEIKIIDLDGFAGQTIKFAFRAFEGVTNGSASVDFFVDNFEVRLTPACSDPTSIQVGNITGTTADFSWNSIPGVVGYEYVVDTNATNPSGSGTFIANNYFTINNLNGLTTYYLHVRSDCGSGVYSPWATVFFTTSCAVINSYPYLEPFNTFVPNICWVEGNGGDTTNGPANYVNGTWIADGFLNTSSTGAVRITLDGATDNDWFISPQFNIPATGYELKFNVGATQNNVVNAPSPAWESDDYIEVLVSSTGNTNWTTLYTYNNTNVPSMFGTTNIIDLDAYAGQVIKLAFKGVEGASNGAASVDFFVDNFEIKLTGACAEPFGIVANNITSSTANIAWNSIAGAAGYEYVLDNVATNPTGSGTFTSTTNYPATGMSGLTTYYFHLRTDCGSGNFSPWVTSSFTTLCSSVTNYPFLEQFNTYLPNACWNEADNGDLVAGPLTFGNSNWIVDGFGNAGTTGAFKTVIDGLGDNDWVLSPEFTIPATGYELNFLASANQLNSLGALTNPWESDDVIEVLVTTSTLNYTNWTVLYTYNNTNVPSYTGTLNTIDLDAYAGQTVRFAFRNLEGPTDGSASVDFFVDNFEVKESVNLNSETFNDSNFIAYPNPIKDKLNLSYNDVISNVSVINMLGLEVLKLNTNAKDVQIDMSNLSSGIYIVNIISEGRLHNLKVVKE